MASTNVVKIQRVSQVTGVAIGTSGISLRETKDKYPTAYQDYTRLQYYSTLFNTIEINSTFHKLHRPATLAKWSREVSNDFRFTCKLWKEVSHKKYLDYAAADLLTFMASLAIDLHKQGCILVQFPASIDVSFYQKVERLLDDTEMVKKDSNWRICVELRHSSWYMKETFEMLDAHGTSIVLHDMPKSKLLLLPPVQTNMVYLRFHGTDGRYGGSYENELLDDYAQQIYEWHEEGKEVYVYFNNTRGNAYENAVLLSQKVKALICAENL